MKTWYEVFESPKEGSKTLETFDTLKEARAFKASRLKKNKGWKLHIDKWGNPENPKILRSVE